MIRLLAASAACVLILAVGRPGFAHDLQDGLVPQPAALRAVIVGSFDLPQDAGEVIQRLETEGFGPVWTTIVEGREVVIVGRCETLPDANLLRNSLRRAGYEDAFTRAFRDLSSPDLVTEATTPDPPTLLREPTAQRSIVSTFDPATRSETASFVTLSTEGYIADAIQGGRDALENLDPNDPARGWLSLNVAHAIVKTERTAAPAMEFILPVARGEIAATDEDRLRAQLMAADAWHYYDFNVLRAYQAYNEILDAHGDDPAIRARTMVEINACLLELARSEGAYFNEVRRYAKKLMAEVPREYTRAHAVADLLYCESLMYEGLMAEAQALLEGFAFRHPARTREIAMANMALGNIGAQTKNWDLCRHHYELVVQTDFNDPAENFYWVGERWNLNEKAAKWLAFYAEQFDDRERLVQYRAYLESRQYEANQPTGDAEFDQAFPHGFYERVSTSQ